MNIYLRSMLLNVLVTMSQQTYLSFFHDTTSFSVICCQVTFQYLVDTEHLFK